VSRRALERVLVLVASGLLGCDGVGRALVGETLDGSGELACDRPRCEERSRPAPPRQADSEPLGVNDCQASSADPRCGPGADPDSLADGAAEDVCGRSLVLDEESAAELRELDCARLWLRRAPGAVDAVLRIEDVRWRSLTLMIETEAPLVLELTRAALSQLRVTLRGPVTLRVVDSQEVSELMLMTDHAAAALELRDSRVSRLRVGVSAAMRFAGTLDVQRSQVADVLAFARTASFESVLLEDARLLADERLDFSDATGRRVVVAADQIVLNVSTFSEIEVERCGRLAAYQTWLSNFRVPACSDDSTRVYGGSMRRGSIEGPIVADRASFERTRFGVLDTTDLQLWDSELSNTAFCAGTDSVTLGGNTSSLCAFCREDDGSLVPVRACRHPDAEPILLQTCQGLLDAPVCEPAPQRMRPPLL
jgi:hypothetical protein